MLQHPDARCGYCSACQYVAATKKIVLAHSAPMGPGTGISQQEADLWNKALEDNPCQHPLVLVDTDIGTLKGCVAFDDPGEPFIRVDTVEFGRHAVSRNKVHPWTPDKALEGIAFEHLQASLANIPQTWYPSLLRTILRAARAKNVFRPGATATIALDIDQEDQHGK